MWLRKLNAFNARRMMNAEAEGGSAAAGAGDSAGSVLFPDDKAEGDQAGQDGDQKAGEGDAAAAAGEWKEYENDPSKSDEENAAAKAEHDKNKPAGDADKKAGEVPADGKYDLKMPDGVELDAELAEALGPEFADLKLTNAQAQKLVDKYIEIQTARGGKQSEAWSQTVQGWADEAKADKEIGGAKWDATVSASQKAVKSLGTPALRDYLNASGGGNHPEMIRFMAKVGAMISEDKPATGGAEGQGKPADAASTLFPNDAPRG